MQNKHDPEIHSIENERLCALMEAAFAAGGDFRFLPTGRSMKPMLRGRRDMVALRPPGLRPPKRYDVILYKRKNGQIVLHRIVGQNERGFRLCGDNQATVEENVRPEMILGVMAKFRRGKRWISADSRLYRLYAALWTALRPARRVAAAAARRIRPFLYFYKK